MNDDLIAGAAQAASFLGLPRRKVYRMIEGGHLPHIRKGRRLFFRKSELQRAFESASSPRRGRRVQVAGFDAFVEIQHGSKARRLLQTGGN